MLPLLITIHVIVCIALIMIVLLQTGKGADMGAAFGGGASQTLFGTSGASTFLSKATTAAAVFFMLSSLILAYMSGHQNSTSIMTEVALPAKQAPAADTDKKVAEATTTEQKAETTATEQKAEAPPAGETGAPKTTTQTAPPDASPAPAESSEKTNN